MKPCIYCGYPSNQMDHIHPRVMGGGDEPSNLAPACGSCNSSKGDRDVSYFLRHYPEVLARVRLHQAGADWSGGLQMGDVPSPYGRGNSHTIRVKLDSGMYAAFRTHCYEQERATGTKLTHQQAMVTALRTLLSAASGS